MNLVFLGMACFLATAAGYWVFGRGPARPTGTLAMGALLGSFALAFASYAPLVRNAVEVVVPHVARLLSNCASLAAATCVLAVSFQVNLEPGEARRRIHTRLALLVTLVLGLAVLFTCEQLAYHPYEMYALYLLLFVAYLSFAVVDFLLQALRQSRATRRVSVRFGLRLAAVGCAFALIYVTYKLAVLLAIVLGSHPNPNPTRCPSLLSSPCVFSVSAPALAVLLICLGLTLPAVVYPLSQACRRRWETRTFAALGPLWTDLSNAMPEIVLPAAQLDDDAVNDSDFLLQRRVIEISDGILALRPYRSRQVHESAQGAVDAGTERGAAFVEASVVKAALTNFRREHRPTEVVQPPVPDASSRDGDLRTEARWLLLVADAYAQSEIARVGDSGLPESVGA